MVEQAVDATLKNSISSPTMMLATKLYVPMMRPNMVPRVHLVEQLNKAVQYNKKLTVISAAPGFGKTTLLSEWLHQLNVADVSYLSQVAWISLDDDDNNAHRFLAYCVAALQRIQPGVGQTALDMLQWSDLQLLTPEMFITTLINEALPITQPLIFVLDDYHVIHNQLIHDSIAFLLDNMPVDVHLVISSRTDPPLPLSRLRGRGQLTELETTDLRFTPAEVAQFLNQTMSLNLVGSEVAALEHRTEGWITGLQMAALSMQGLDDTANFVSAFTGSHRHILDYLLEEVLNRQPEHVQDFLLKTSILNRLSGPLCTAILADEDETDAPLNSQQILEYLEQTNLFILPLDNHRQWYRYHHLFADLLRHRLETNQTDIKTLHLKASRWYEQSGLPVDALSHALVAVDVAQVVKLARQKAETMLSRTESVTLLSWLDTLPRALNRSQPRVLLLRAWAMLLTGELQAVEVHLDEAEQAFKAEDSQQTEILGEIATLRGGVAYFERDMLKAIGLYQQALEYLPADNLFLRGIVLQCLGAAYSWCGTVIEATQAYTEAGHISRTRDNTLVSLITLWNLGQLYTEQGYLHQASSAYQEGITLFDRQSEHNKERLLPFVGRLYVGLAYAMYQRNNLAASQQQLLTGLDLGEQTQEANTLTHGYLLLARLNWCKGDSDGIADAMQKARYFAKRYASLRYLTTVVETFQAELWLAEGNLRAVAYWVNKQELQPDIGSIPYIQEGEYLILAQLLLAQSQLSTQDMMLAIDNPLDTAVAILSIIGNTARQTRRFERVIETLILQATCFYEQGNKEEALNSVQQALTLAEPEEYIRIFVDKGVAYGVGDIGGTHPSSPSSLHHTPGMKPPEQGFFIGETIQKLLQQGVFKNISREYMAKLTAAFSPVAYQAAALLDPLSEREMEILRLIATGMSNKELAEELIVTVGTVKWHLNNIYSKLGVRSRTQAVAQARELNLL